MHRAQSFRHQRRQFLGDIGKGMLLAGLGASLSHDLGLETLAAEEATERLNFGPLESLVSTMQETGPEQLMGLLVQKLRSGTDLRTLVAAGALSNARTFGGQDYIGFHTIMALAPAYRMSLELPAERAPLPVLKVLYRNAQRIQEFGGTAAEVLHPVQPAALPQDVVAGEHIRELARQGDMQAAERAFATVAQGPLGEAFNHLHYEMEDEVEVHRVVLAWRAWDTLELAGPEWAHCLLRQSVRYCVTQEKQLINRGGNFSSIRTVLPKLLDQYHLVGKELGTKQGDDGWLLQLARSVRLATKEQAAEVVAQSLAEGFAPESIGEALSLAANQLVLHDPGRIEKWSSKEKPAGSCHGDSVGVHASDAANAWRNIVRVSNPRNLVAALVVGGYHTGGQSGPLNQEPYPLAAQIAEISQTDPIQLLTEAEAAIRARDQFRAAACVAKYGQLGHEPRAVFDVLLRYATSEDGALHAEKYYHTVCAEFAATRPAFRWNQLVALARVSASEYGYRSPGYESAKALLKV